MSLTLLLRKPTVSDIVFGSAGLGGLYNPVSDEDALGALEAAWEGGIRCFDSAPLYGAGLSEERLGKVLASKEGAVIDTKAGRLIKSKTEEVKGSKWFMNDYEDFYFRDGKPADVAVVYDYSSQGVRQSLEESRKRLQGMKVRSLRLHDAETEERLSWATESGQAIDTLVEMRKEGLIEKISLGMNDASFLQRIVDKYPEGTFDNIMVAGCWNLLDFTGRDLFALCEKKGVKVIQAGVFGSGLLWGRTHLRYTEAPPEAVSLTARWSDLAAKHNVSLPAVALTFSFLPSVVEQVCIGCKRPSHVQTNLALLNEDIPLDLWKEAKEEGLLPEWMPIPSSS